MISKKIGGLATQVRLKINDNPLLFPLALFFFTLITYGVFLFKQGFYWDDWPPILLSHLADKQKIWEYFVFDRPFQSWTYYLLFPVCKVSTECWQFSAIVFRWLSGFLLYLTFLRLFPKNKKLLQWTAIFFVVFPGFSNQYSSVSFVSHFIIYSVFAASLLTLVLGIQKGRLFWLLIPISYLLTAIHLFSMEYFVGLEVIRGLILFYLIYDRHNPKISLGKFFLNTFPYLVILGIYLFWRIKLYPDYAGVNQGDNAPYLFSQLLATPLPTLISFIQTIISDLKFLFVSAWTDRLIPDVLPINSATFWLSTIIGFITTGFYVFLFSRNKEYEKQANALDYKRIFLFGLAIVFFGLLPAWSTFRQITVGKWSDRYSISVMFGASLVIVTILFRLFNKKYSQLIFLFLTAFSISYQIQLGNEFRKDYLRQKSFYTQLSWRIPELEPGSVIYSPGIPAGKEADYSIAMGLNLLYSSQINEHLDYWFLVPRYASPESLVKNPGQPIEQGLRIFSFTGSGDKIVSVQLPDQGCLWVINKYYALSPKENIADYAKFSNESLITIPQNREKTLIESIIDLSPQNTWCYYFEKIDLARSKGDYSQAIDLFQTSAAQNLKPIEGVEYLPVVQSYAAIENIDKAMEITYEAISITPASSTVFCGFWDDIKKVNPDLFQIPIETFLSSDNCQVNL